MAMMDCAVTSRTIPQQFIFVTHYSVSTRTIRPRLQQSGMSKKCALFHLPSTENHRRLRSQWRDERWTRTMEWNGVY
ncbi:hypothetical protein TNCV_771951 [Trichonephila clavipes]|nr:hypothetical protein TNCV_771951 [Trichonephila clavipes]